MNPDPIDREKEYEALRRELELYIPASEALQRNCVIAVALTYAWLITQSAEISGVTKTIGYAIPIAIAVLGAIKSYAMEKHAGMVGGYLLTVETTLNRPGWESYFKSQKRGFQGWALTAFWTVFFLTTIAAFYVQVWG